VRPATTLTITITATITAVTTFTETTQFDLVTTIPICTISPETITITPSTLTDQTYTWLGSSDSFTFANFSEDSLSCSTSDIVLSMVVTNSDSQDTSFITFDDSTRTVTWYLNTVRAATTFTVTITGTINALST